MADRAPQRAFAGDLDEIAGATFRKQQTKRPTDGSVSARVRYQDR
jgi:hypothetical protein